MLCLLVCFLSRLLKVKPEERLTIEGVLDHPWLNSTEALDNVLPSAQLMMDKVLSDGLFGCLKRQCEKGKLGRLNIVKLVFSCFQGLPFTLAVWVWWHRAYMVPSPKGFKLDWLGRPTNKLSILETRSCVLWEFRNEHL